MSGGLLGVKREENGGAGKGRGGVGRFTSDHHLPLVVLRVRNAVRLLSLVEYDVLHARALRTRNKVSRHACDESGGIAQREGGRERGREGTRAVRWVFVMYLKRGSRLENFRMLPTAITEAFIRTHVHQDGD
jgi:hypothetical protein